jgi:hypothetical protein
MGPERCVHGTMNRFTMVAYRYSAMGSIKSMFEL